MDLSRRSIAIIAGVVVTVLVVAGALLLGSGGDGADLDDPGTGGPGVSTVPTTSPDLVAPARGPAPPSDGAWVGAWVKPDVQTQAGRLDAVAAFEKEIGRPLDLVHVYHSIEDFPAAADTEVINQGKTLMISWSGDDTRVITSGRDDAIIRARAEGIKDLGAPVLLRWRFEMNRPNLQASVWSPADFVAAWKHVRAIFTEVGATNAAWVWCPLATDFDATRGPAYYPGDDQVEWLCADVYPGPDYSSFSAVSQQFMAWASLHAKPIIIGEFGAEDAGSLVQRADWLTGVDTYVHTHPQIKAIVYFNARRSENGNDRDFTLAGTGPVLGAFRKMVLDPYFDRDAGTG